MDGVHENYFGDQHHWPQSKLGREEHGHSGHEMCGSDPGFTLAYHVAEDGHAESHRLNALAGNREASRKVRAEA